MECRPFKDPNYDLRRSELDRAVQACAPTSTSSSQTTGFLQRPATTQYAPLDYPPDKKAAQLRGAGMVAFLRSVLPRCELALVQNELTNVFRDELSLLGSEEGVSGGGKESQVTETQSFTHLVYSKNKVVTAIQWLPHRKGVIAVACTDNSSNSERIAKVWCSACNAPSAACSQRPSLLSPAPFVRDFVYCSCRVVASRGSRRSSASAPLRWCTPSRSRRRWLFQPPVLSPSLSPSLTMHYALTAHARYFAPNSHDTSAQRCL